MNAMPYADVELARFRADYVRDGVVHLPGLLSLEWVDRLVGAIGRAREELAPTGRSSNPWAGGAPPSHAGYRTAEYSHAPGRFTIRWLWRDVDDVRRFFTASGVAPVVAAVIGARRVQYWYDLTFIHDPGADGEGTPWHHDIAAFPCKGEQIPSLWIAMSDIGREMAPLECVRGSHRNPTMFRPPVYVDPGVALPDGYGDLPDVAAKVASGEYEVVSWDVKAGDALLIHPYTLHGAPANRADRPRIAFTTRWAGDDVVWRPDAFSMKVPGVDLATVPVGRRPDGEFFPYAE